MLQNTRVLTQNNNRFVSIWQVISVEPTISDSRLGNNSRFNKTLYFIFTIQGFMAYTYAVYRRLNHYFGYC